MPEEPAEVPDGTGPPHERQIAGQPSGRRELTRRWAPPIGAAGAAAVALGAGRAMVMPSLTRQGLATPDGIFDAAATAVADSAYTEVFPTSPLPLSPFNDPLPILKALSPHHEGYEVGQSVDNLYLNWPTGNDETEKQSFCWFHDHRMDHTGANVYKGMVGRYPIYDPTTTRTTVTSRRACAARRPHEPSGRRVRHRVRHSVGLLRRPDGRRRHLRQDCHDSSRTSSARTSRIATT